jgi:poly-gamma-glutamate synthesis protein (capsule biosynthesis protein)
MSKIPRKKSASPYKKDPNIYKKSRYYKETRRRMILTGGLAGGFLLLILLGVVVIRQVGSGSANEASVASLDAQNSLSADDAASEGATTAGNAESDGTFAAESTGAGETDDSQQAASKAANLADDSSESSTTITEPVSVTVTVVGDCTLGTDPSFDYSSSLNQYFYDYGASYFLENVQTYFANDDLTIANFEGALTDSDEQADKEFTFKGPAEFTQILTEGSVEAVNTANNHSHDYGEQGFTDTLAALDDAGIVHFGYDETAIYEVKGIKIGLVGIYELNDHLDREQQLKDNIAAVKAEGADLVIVIFHWGNEKETYPDDNQLTLGHMAIDEGADLVCGHHPHVLQGIETYKGKNIVYSLGNFCFGGNSSPSDMDTMIYQQTFTITSEGVKEDQDVNVIPCSISSASYYNNYQPTPAEGEEATRITEKIEERSSWIPSYEGSSEE